MARFYLDFIADSIPNVGQVFNDEQPNLEISADPNSVFIDFIKICNKLEDFYFRYCGEHQIKKSVDDAVVDVIKFDIRLSELKKITNRIEKFDNVSMSQQLQDARLQLLKNTDWVFVTVLINEIRMVSEFNNFANQIQQRMDEFEKLYEKNDGLEEENVEISEILNDLNLLSACLAEPLKYVICRKDDEELGKRFGILLGRLQRKKNTERQAQQIISELSTAISLAKSLTSFENLADIYKTLCDGYTKGFPLTFLPCNEKTRITIQILLLTADELKSRFEERIREKILDFESLHAKLSRDIKNYLNEFNILILFKGSISDARKCAKLMQNLKNNIQKSKEHAFKILRPIADNLKHFPDNGGDRQQKCVEIQSIMEKICSMINEELDIIEREICDDQQFQSQVQKVVNNAKFLIVPQIIEDPEAEKNLANQNEILRLLFQEKKKLKTIRKYVLPNDKANLESLLKKTKCLKFRISYDSSHSFSFAESNFENVQKICQNFEQIVGGDITFENAWVNEMDAERKPIDNNFSIAEDNDKSGVTDDADDGKPIFLGNIMAQLYYGDNQLA